MFYGSCCKFCNYFYISSCSKSLPVTCPRCNQVLSKIEASTASDFNEAFTSFNLTGKGLDLNYVSCKSSSFSDLIRIINEAGSPNQLTDKLKVFE